jgi:hypothetical protein
MSNLIPANVKVPAHLVARMNQPSALAQSMTGGLGGGESFPRISIKGGRFRIKEGDVETILDSTKLDVVIVGANPKLSKTYYAKEWTKDAEPAAPDCFSLNGTSPDASVENPQNDLCATCPHNAWGSKTTANGQQVKACSDQKRLAVVAADDPSGPVYLLSVTPAALKGLNTYQKELSMRGIPPEVVKTRVSFDTDASFPKLVFGFGGFLDEDTQAIVDELFGTDKVKEITGELVKAQPVQIQAPRQSPVKPAPVAEKPAPKAKPAPSVFATEEEEEVPATPAPAAPKRGFGAKAEAPAAAEKPAPKAKAAPKAEPAGSSLADEIAALIGEVADDE